jgi:iron complex outermembrane receptor protein
MPGWWPRNLEVGRRGGQADGRVLASVALLIGLSFSLTAFAKDEVADAANDLTNLSIEELANISISSVSKSSESLSKAPAAVFVISHDDILRSGARSIPEILRLAPNLHVAQITASSYAISARGFNGNLADKLLVLIDGRSVYTPLYGGVYWDMQDVMPEDIDRVEVISGPGATLWGANAVNGVINIITRKSGGRTGALVAALAGNADREARAQYDGNLGGDVTYRVYAKASLLGGLDTVAGPDANDGWSRRQAGFRGDWSAGADTVTLQGDLYGANEQQTFGPNQSVEGRNLLTRWTHQLKGGSQIQVQAYYDETRRFTGNNGGGFVLDMYDLEVQHDFQLGGWNSIIWGAGERISAYEITNLAQLLFVPDSRRLHLSDAFIQDTLSLTDAVKLTLGVKDEIEPYSGSEFMPSARVSWEVSQSALLWSAVSRAVRAPTPFDVDLVEKLGSTPFLTGSNAFQPEKLVAYEIGARAQPLASLSFSISAFYNDYDDLRSIELAANGKILPLHFDNLMEGETHGVEMWANYQLAPWWRLAAALTVQRVILDFKPGSSQLGGTALAGDDPNHQASLRSFINLSESINLSSDLRYVGLLPNPRVPQYFELNTALGWKVWKYLDVSLSGRNLLHPQHQEFSTPPINNDVPRSFFVETRWSF